MNTVYLGLGTNIGNRHENLERAAKLLEQDPLNIIQKSTVIETDPVDYLDQDKFLNQIIIVDTTLEPVELLQYLQNIEKDMGRVKIIEKGPRLIDIDILLFNNIVLNENNLIIPHPGIYKREFILFHLIELNRELKDPGSGRLFAEIYRDLKSENNS